LFGSQQHLEALKLTQDPQKSLAQYYASSEMLATAAASIKEMCLCLENQQLWQENSDKVHAVTVPPRWAKDFFKKEIRGLLF